jgi:hypothetical protein
LTTNVEQDNNVLYGKIWREKSYCCSHMVKNLNQGLIPKPIFRIVKESGEEFVIEMNESNHACSRIHWMTYHINGTNLRKKEEICALGKN